MWWFVLGQALAGCGALALRQPVGDDPAWLPGDVATVWSAGTLWWLDPKGLRSTPAAPGQGVPVGRLGTDVVWGELRDDVASYAVTGRTWPFAVTDWRAVGAGALVLGRQGDKPSAHRLGADGEVTELAMPAVQGGAEGLADWMQEACASAMPARLRPGTSQLLATACTLPAQSFLVGLDGAVEPLPSLPGRKELALVAGSDRLAAVVQEQAEVGTTAWLAWGTPQGWTIETTSLPQDRAIDLAVVDGLRYTLTTHEGRHVVRCEQEELGVEGGAAAAFGGQPLHGSEAWGLATLVKVKDQWWIASTRTPGTE